MNQLFGHYLVQKGLLAPKQVLMVLDKQREMRRPIGKIAIETQLLTVKQVFQVLNAQADNRQKLFGELAVELGYITEDDLQELLSIQAKAVLPFGEMLVHLNLMSRPEMEKELSNFMGKPD